MKQLNIYKPAITLRRAIYSTAGLLLLCTIMSGIVLSSTTTHAVTKSSTATVNVTLSCTMSTSPGTGGTATADGYSYSATIDPGQYAEINGTIMTTTCTGTGNYSLYAIGYSGDSYDTPTNTQLISSNTSVANIPTGTATSGGTSNWAFKLAASGSYSPTIISPYNNYANIPGDDFTKIATYIPGTTGSATSSSVQAKYRVYITSTQPVGTYTGKVKYTMVYPNDAPTPSLKTIATASTMQEVEVCPASLPVGTTNTLTDARDNSTYTVAKLGDGNCWMTQNLRITGTVASAQSNFSGNSINVCAEDLANDSSYRTLECHNSGNTTNGVWYNYAAASAGTITGLINTTEATSDICPSGWKMPSNSQISGVTSYKSTFNPVAGGRYHKKDNKNTSNGYWWSTTAYDNHSRYNLRYSDNALEVHYLLDRDDGFYIRCVFKQ